MIRVVEALAREVGSVGKLLHTMDGPTWSLPTRCDPMTVKDLVAHMLRGAVRINEMLDSEPLDEPPQKDAITWWNYDRATTGVGVVERALADSRDRSPDDLTRAWDVDWSRALRRARDAIDADLVYRSAFGTIRLSEFVRTRIIEVTVHHMDLDDAIGREPHPDPGAIEAVGDVLRGLLGTDLRPLGVDDVRFALVGTGRAPLDEREHGFLGPLADLFPLLA